MRRDNMSTTPMPPRKRVALVCTNFTMQSAFGLLIIAINSVRLGFETMIYFTFEGLHMIRPGHLAQLRYYPTGVDPSKAEVDRYTTELRDRMERKDIPYVEDMLEMAQLEGVRFLACKTSVDLFDLGKQDFIEGVEIMLAGDFMKQATGSDLHLIF
jgi:peroxiredoxin family protein